MLPFNLLSLAVNYGTSGVVQYNYEIIMFPAPVHNAEVEGNIKLSKPNPEINAKYANFEQNSLRVASSWDLASERLLGGAGEQLELFGNSLLSFW